MFWYTTFWWNMAERTYINKWIKSLFYFNELV